MSLSAFCLMLSCSELANKAKAFFRKSDFEGDKLRVLSVFPGEGFSDSGGAVDAGDGFAFGIRRALVPEALDFPALCPAVAVCVSFRADSRLARFVGPAAEPSCCVSFRADSRLARFAARARL